MKRRILTFLLVCIIVQPFVTFPAAAVASPPSLQPVQPSSVTSNPAVLNVNTSLASRYTHPDFTTTLVDDKTHFVYRREEAGTFNFYYRQVDQLDYMSAASPEILIGQESVPASPQPYQYARISSDTTGGIHVVWVHERTLKYRSCYDGCTNIAHWNPIQDLTQYVTTTDCSIYHPQIVAWVKDGKQGNPREVAILVEVSPNANKIRLIRGTDGMAWEGTTVSENVDNNQTYMVRTPSVAYDASTDMLHMLSTLR